ncbi:MAG: TM1812 family CRISPR-associated protein [Oscillospiraceae bacterium]|nr:TM1812 family CRISPR-associated protein [Oscillospiraceae bacterium]
MAIRNVFVTTLSTFSGDSRFYYYYATVNGERKYFTGVSTNEPGAKYILATQPVDRIVMIGSDRTWNTGDNTGAWIDEIDTACPPEEDISSLSFLEYRLAQFVRDEERDWENRLARIDPKRRQELQNLVREVMTGNGYRDAELWFDILTEKPELVKTLNQRIQDDIQSGYASPEDYALYGSSGMREFPELKKLEEGDISAQKMIEELRHMKDDAFASLIDREAFLLLGVTTVEKRITALELERQKKQNEALTEIISKLQQLNSQLQLELRDVKSRRIDEETAYTGQYLYDKLNSDRKLRVLPGEHREELAFVPLMRGEIDNISGIIQAIYASFPEEDEIRLYVDVQGGGRTDAFIRNQIFTVLNNETDSRISIRQIISTGFEKQNFANLLKDETERYRINDLVAGMHAFVNYGKVGTLKRFFQGRQDQQDYLTSLMDVMENIDRAISLCDVERLENNILQLRKKLNEVPEADSTSAEIFAVLKAGIERDYGKLLESDSIDPVELIRWAKRKELIQQTLTIIEARTPELIINRKLLYFPEEECEILEDIKYYHSDKDKQKEHQTIEQYLCKGYAKDLKKDVGEYRRRNVIEVLAEELNRSYRDQKKQKQREYNYQRVNLYTQLTGPYINKLWSLLDQYDALNKMRNDICHPTGDHPQPEYENVRKAITRFVDTLDDLLNNGMNR